MGGRPAKPFPITEEATLIIREARARDELVFAFKQSWTAPSNIPSAMQDQYSAKGYCLGLCAQWIGLRLEGGNFDYDREYKSLSPDATMTGLYLQAVYSNRFDKEVWKFDVGHPVGSMVNFIRTDWDAVNRAAQNDALAYFGLKLSPHPIRMVSGANGGFLLACAQAIPGACLIDWAGPGGAHATAINSRPQEQVYEYFDPNCGQFVFRSRQRLKDWFDDYAARMDYRHRMDRMMQFKGITAL